MILQPFGRLQEKLDLDMGFGPPIPQLHITPIPTDEQGFVRGFAPVGVIVARQVAEEVPDFQSDNGGCVA